MRVLVVDESAERAEMLRAALTPAGYEVTALSSALALLKTIETLAPDVIVIDTDSPSLYALEHPVVMLCADGTPVSAYVVNGIAAERIQPILNAAIARFQEMQSLRAQLADANRRLVERKLIERAKGLLMKSRKLDEEAAYALLRKAAMDRKVTLADVAQRILDGANLLGA